MPHINYARELISSFNLVPPINPFEICNYFDIEIVDKNLEKAEAIFLIKDAKKKIILNKSIWNEERRKFTIAHELGHYYIPWHDNMMYSCTINTYSSIEEYQANEFASEILIPTKFIQEDLKNKDINFNILRDLVGRYEISLTAFSIKAVVSSNDSLAFITTKNGIITGVYKSRFFDKKIKNRDEYIHESSGAYKLYENLHTDYFNDIVPPETWITDDDITEELIENSIYFPRYNSTLTILKVKRQVYNPYNFDF